VAEPLEARRGILRGVPLENASEFRRRLKAWGQEHFRAFPWRLTREPYRILIAEVMLHRTQARQVSPVYRRFIRSYPNVLALSKATRREIRESLRSLGLSWRIDLVYNLGQVLRSRFRVTVPKGREELLSLPGVSDYIASAVRCFSWELPEVLVDTNTVRVVSRLFGLEHRDSLRRNRHFRELSRQLVDPEEPRFFNYALLDLADLVCTRRRPPDCPRCPVRNFCIYGASVSQETRAASVSISRPPKPFPGSIPSDHESQPSSASAQLRR
jgi:A/G-specific adenine glycosylase